MSFRQSFMWLSRQRRRSEAENGLPFIPRGRDLAVVRDALDAGRLRVLRAIKDRYVNARQGDHCRGSLNRGNEPDESPLMA